MKVKLIFILLFILSTGYIHAQEKSNRSDVHSKISFSDIPGIKVDTTIFMVDKIVVPYNKFIAIDPNSIDNITILKDSSANSLYGLRGKSAVIQITTKSAKAKTRLVSFATPGPNFPLLLVDGIETDLQLLENIKPESIKFIQVLKDVAATAVYGIKGAHGVILVTTKSSVKKNDLLIRDVLPIPEVALLIIDGKPVGIDFLSNISSDNISKIQVLKGKDATSLYGSQGTHGVILVTTKNNKKIKK